MRIAPLHNSLRWPAGRCAAAMEVPTISRKKGLRVEVLDKAHGMNLFTVAGVLTPDEAQRFIDAAEAAGFEHQGSRGPAYGEAYRDNHRLQVHDPDAAAHLWDAGGLREACRGLRVDGLAPVGLNPNLRLYRYGPGQQFGKHIDEANVVQGVGVTKYTVLVYLSGRGAGAGGAGGGGGDDAATGSKASGKGRAASATKRAAASADAAATPPLPDTRAVQPLDGGETAFYGARGSRLIAAVSPAPGLALLHAHGDACLEHAGLEVRSGTKYLFRSDVVFA